MAHEDCTITTPHGKHDINVGNMRYDIYERCYGIPTAEKVLRDKQKAKRKAAKADLKYAKKMLRLEVKWDKMARSARNADDLL